jgi:glyoxylase-like metal-dependent hydrolase (beta-lactamase superfamily II)
MEIIALSSTGFSSNCYIVHNGTQAFVVDPSISEKKILSKLKEKDLSLKGILLTHGHFDHIWRAQELRDETRAPLYVHELDNEMLTDARKNAYRTFTGMNFVINEADILLKDGDTLSLGDEQIKVLHTPGHTKGSVCYDTGDSLLSGDTIFAEGFGRCDLYGGDMNALKNSIQMLSKMAESENRWLYSGHGESSTLRKATENLKYYF